MAVLPFVDLTLISCNCASAIVFNMLLSVFYLGEKFVWQYDLFALLFIITGTVMIALTANTDPVSFTGP